MIFPPRWSELASPLSPLWDIAKLIFFVLLISVPWMFLMACSTPSISTTYLDSVAVERARYVCTAAMVPVAGLPSCITREVASRRDNSWFGPWSPL
jgi:hypothetical protein